MHAPTEDNDDTKDNFYGELEYVFDQFLKYHMKISLGEKTFSKQQSGTTVYMKLVMIMRLE
jgi:hypothetical protein